VVWLALTRPITLKYACVLVFERVGMCARVSVSKLVCVFVLLCIRVPSLCSCVRLNVPLATNINHNLILMQVIFFSQAEYSIIHTHTHTHTNTNTNKHTHTRTRIHTHILLVYGTLSSPPLQIGAFSTGIPLEGITTSMQARTSHEACHYYVTAERRRLKGDLVI